MMRQRAFPVMTSRFPFAPVLDQEIGLSSFPFLPLSGETSMFSFLPMSTST